MIQYFNFGITLLAAICVVLTSFYLLKYKKKEDERLFKGYNAIISSMFLLGAYLLIKVFNTFVNLFWDLSIVYYLNFVTDVVIVSLIVLCMLIGVMLFKEV